MVENKVSVVIPVYNTKRYLQECVRSVTGQTYRNIEILLIDDGSTDGSGALCDEIAVGDDRVRVIHKPNGGVAAARNTGIDEANGEYVMFLDSDDWLDTDAIATLIKHADVHMTDVIRFSYVREYEGKQQVKRNTFLEERVYTGDECLAVCRQVLGLTGKELRHPENFNFLASCCTGMYKKSMLVDVGVRFTNIWEIGSFEDGLFNFCVLLKAKRFEYIHKPFYHYRKTNAGSETTGYRRDYIAKRLVLAERLKEKINQENQWDYFCEAFYNRIVHATMEISFNALRNKAAFIEKYKEVHSVLHHPQFISAYKAFQLRDLGMKWKIYFFFIKHSMTLPTYLMTAVILKLKSRGVL